MLPQSFGWDRRAAFRLAQRSRRPDRCCARSGPCCAFSASSAPWRATTRLRRWRRSRSPLGWCGWRAASRAAPLSAGLATQAVATRQDDLPGTDSPWRQRLGFAIGCGAEPTLVARSEEHTSELQSLMRNSYVVFCLKKKITLFENTSTNMNSHSSDHDDYSHYIFIKHIAIKTYQ